MCGLLEDNEEKINCCTKALKLADEERLVGPQASQASSISWNYVYE